ncbi:hypothetical protein [Fluviicola chungangensis]|uniref:Uncharacterized protein n=1 Tax=Fluviicola chungangensis TaxID=2597671 RepID=A0A556N2M3_9FLAO|nr:hypothetical protein [Fluviicola chungangensis]TSJ46333.1 hypothetical protein FO442_04025 [Fluviicola chungangensis]
MEEQHERLFDLIASKPFEDLNKEERSFVLNHLTEAEYSLQRKVIATAEMLEYDSGEPLALRLPKTKTHLLNRSIPLYQVLIGAACLVLLFMAGKQKNYSLNWHFSEHPLEISLANGVSSGKIIHDTIIKEIPVLRTVSDVIHDTITIVQTITRQPERRMLEAGNTLIYPELNEKLFETRSVPYKEDQTARFLPDVSVMNTLK